MSNIYDDVTELQSQVAQLQTTVSQLNSRLVKTEATHWFGLDTSFLVN